MFLTSFVFNTTYTSSSIYYFLFTGENIDSGPISHHRENIKYKKEHALTQSNNVGGSVFFQGGSVCTYVHVDVDVE